MMTQQINNYINTIMPKFIFGKPSITLFLMVIFFFNINKSALTKNLSNKKFMCADKIGPRVEFLIPDFDKESKTKNFSFKIFDEKNRESSKEYSSNITKKNSPIDYSYDYYTAKLLDKNQSVIFEFFPPSTMMIKNGEKPFETLACWEN